MRRADRLFQIVQLLRSRRLWTARQLAGELEVSERTVYRDMQDLMLSGVPIQSEAGVGYALRKGFELPPLMFTREELNALALGARIVRSWADHGLGQAAQNALRKVEAALPKALQHKVADVPLLAPLIQISPPVAKTLAGLRPAIDARRKVSFGYTREDGASSTRTVWPLGLFFWGRVWTLGAWCELRNAFRNFRLDRMTRLSTCEEHYPDMPGRRLNDLIQAYKKCGDTNHE
ncbi:MAG TPA: YafY family transcriptional regulator [Gammaproteobacteria bacterium]|nr:YafY family transcriptional regulator [Gammaproteobacteria bacterium]